MPSILDLGCGNGRFARFLSDDLGLPFDYLGVDSNLGLLVEAKHGLGVRASVRQCFAQLDLVLDGLQALAPENRSALIVALGLMHHVPSLERRMHLVRELASRMAPGGFLALSFWQFGGLQRFLGRQVSWQDYNRWSGDPIDLVELEEGDMLLAWGPEESASGPAARMTSCTRYCHFTNPLEAAQLIAGLGCEVVESFHSDGETGGLNLYFLLRAPA